MDERTCTADSCTRPVQVKARDLCWTHYKRWQRHGDAELPSWYDKDALTRFFERVSVGDCWEWTAAISRGYGNFWPPGGREPVAAHIWLYRELVGPVPIGCELDHLCRNRSCVNPDHLEPVAPAENKRRGMSPVGMNSRKTECPVGHFYDERNTIISSGHRVCRTCKNAYRRRWRAARRAQGQARGLEQRLP